MKYLSSLLIIISVAFIFTTSSCKKCVAPTIAFDPAAAVDKYPGQTFTVNVNVDGGESNISTITVSRTVDGVETPEFISLTGVGAKTKTVVLTDSVPTKLAFFSTLTYKVRAIIDCRKSLENTQTFTVTVVPSPVLLDDLLYLVQSTQSPYVFSHFTTVPANPKSWDLQGRAGRNNTNPTADEDIQDSSTGASGATLFSTVVRWGSRDGSKFVKAPGFDWANASAKSIVDAYKAGTPVDLITYATNDYIIVNIKNKNKFAVVKIRTIFDDGPANDDYTFFAYKLAQL